MTTPVGPNPHEASALAVPAAAHPLAVMALPAGHSPYFGPTGAGPEPPAPWFLDVAGVLRRHPIVVLLAVVAFGWVGYRLGQVYQTNLWAVEGRLRYVKPPASDGIRPAYDSMALPTYADLLTSDELLRPIADEFRDRLGGDDPVRSLKRDLKVEPPRGADMIEIRWDAADPPLAADVINRLMTAGITYTNNLRRNTILRQAAEQLQHRIIDCDAQIRRIEKTVLEYQARVRSNTPIEKLDAVEIDAYHAQRRRGILDQIAAEQVKIKDKRITEASLRSVIKLKEEHLRARIIPELELVDSQRQLHDVQESIKLSEDEVRRLEDRYREVPIEYANTKVLELKVKMTEAEMDTKLLQRKSAAALSRGVPVLAIDPDDEDWAKLKQRLIGPDTPEFEMMQPATVPTRPTASNRKLLTFAAAGGPLALLYLCLAFSDHRRRGAAVIIPGDHPLAASPRHAYSPHNESALLSLRIQQWIAGRPGDADPPGRP